MEVTVAVDCMGGDHGIPVTVPAALDCLARTPEAKFILVGKQDEISAALTKHHATPGDRLSIHHAPEVIAMHEPPAVALRNKKNASMRLAVNLVKDGTAHACVSAGNTGALMAISRFVLKTLPAIERPAICSVLPTLKGEVYVLDLGANVDCTPENLQQWAIMAATLVNSVTNKERPSVGLLNIGEEDIKGNEVVKRAGELLRGSDINFYGNVEGDDIYKGTTDVVVCDGFVGNVTLKASEGLARMLATYLREEYKRNLLTRIAGLLSLPVLKSFKRRVDPSRYNGATLLGLRGIVIKSHGSADRRSFRAALNRAIDEANGGVLAHITERMAAVHEAAS